MPVDDLDRLHFDRSVRTGALLFPRVAFDEGAQVPLAVRLLAADNPRPRERHRADDDAALHQLANAVGHRNFVDVNERLRAPRDVDVAEPDAAEQGTLEPANRQRRGQVLIGLADEQCANAVLGPARFDDQEPEKDENQGRDEQTNDDPGHRHRNPAGSSSPHHDLIVADS
jgi:hypothetical protein